MTQGLPAARLYFGSVMHARLKPFTHRFRYRVFSLLVDVDRIGEIARQSRLFSYNRWNILSFYDRDHGARDGAPLRAWAEERLTEASIALDGGTIRLLCFPRLLGYVFNPISLYYCHGPDGALRAVIHQVNNTFGDTHSYVIPVRTEPREVIRQKAGKNLHVSPFMDMDHTYWFALRPPADRLRVAIRQENKDGVMLLATLVGTERPFSDSTLMQALVRFPLMSWKVMAAIHWEALHLVRKGARYHKRPPAPEKPATIGEDLP